MFHQAVHPFRNSRFLSVICGIIRFDIQDRRTVNGIQSSYRKAVFRDRQDLNGGNPDPVRPVFSPLGKDPCHRHIITILRPSLKVSLRSKTSLVQQEHDNCVGKILQALQASDVRPVKDHIGNILSPAAIAMLAVYCLAAGVENAPRALSIENAAAAAGTLTVVLLQYWKRNPLVSIICGTAVNMILLQCFA